MCQKRKITSVIRPGMVDIDTIDEQLQAEGVSKEELARDLGYSLTIGGRYGYAQCLKIPKIGKVGEDKICTILDNMDWNSFNAYWEDVECREKIAALIRYPGGLHEWLMVSAIPLLKEIGIPLGFVKGYRDKTESCTFTIDDEKGWHGGKLSGEMHNILYSHIYEARCEYKQLEKNDQVPKNAQYILAQWLKAFMEEVSIDNPEVLRKLIYNLES